VHDSMPACGGKRQLHPTKVAASAPMRSVLIVYLLSKNVKHPLSVRPPPREALAWLMSAQRGFAAGE
jgi:hypothetical protein